MEPADMTNRFRWRPCLASAIGIAGGLSMSTYGERNRDLSKPSVHGELIVGLDGPLTERLSLHTFEGFPVVDRDRHTGALLIQVPVGMENRLTDELAGHPDVTFVERNGIGSGSGDPAPIDDTFAGLQWHLRNTGQTGGVRGADVNAIEAWEVESGDAGVVVAILDSGLDLDHPEFAGRVAPGGFDFVNEDALPEDDHGHGTAVAGVLAANANNTFGVAGIDHAVQILPIKVLGSNNFGTTFDFVQGLNEAAARDDVTVISMSLQNFPDAVILQNALASASDAGKILVACAGNFGLGHADESWPGASFQTVSIGATDDEDQRADFSATGTMLDFVAPGRSIRTVRFDDNRDGSSVWSGTSFAAPIASGAITLMIARADQDSVRVTQDEAFEILREGAVDMIGNPFQDVPGRDDFYGYGRVDVSASLLALDGLLGTGSSCPADTNADDIVGFVDLLHVLSCSGNDVTVGCARADSNNDGVVDFADLVGVVAGWGRCPNEG